MVYPSSRQDDLARGAYQCSVPTHGSRLAICAASAVACAIAAALEGGPAAVVLDAAVEGSRKAEEFRASQETETITTCLSKMYSDLAGRKQLAVDEIAESYFPDRTLMIVPLAISLALVTRSAEQTTLIAANLGGDADSVASIGSAIAAALCPETVNAEWFEVVNSINADEVIELATSLAAMRDLTT